jgi:hypothetical protein
VVLERIEESQNTQPAFSLLRRGSLRFFAALQSEGWARQDSNLGPRDYESPALTAELQARLLMKNGVGTGVNVMAGASTTTRETTEGYQYRFHARPSIRRTGKLART